MTPEELALLIGQNKSTGQEVPAWAQMMSVMQNQQTQPAPTAATTEQPTLPLRGYSTTTPTMMSDQVSNTLMSRINAQGLESRKAQQKGLSGLEQYIEQYKNAPVEGGFRAVDLTPIAALVDSWTGSKLAPAAASIKRPETAEEKKMKLLGLEQVAQKQRENITDKDLDLLKLQLNNQLAKETLQYGREKNAATLGKGKELSQATIKQIDEGNAIPGMLANLDGLIDTHKGLFGPAQGIVSSKNPYNETAQTIQSEMKAKSQAFGRFMEGGVLRKEDEAKYEKMFPNLTDLPEVAKSKLKIVDDLLRQKQQSLIDSYQAQGFGMQGLDLPAKPQTTAPDEGATKEWEGKKYRVIGGRWVQYGGK